MTHPLQSSEAASLRAAGLRVTATRLAVLGAVREGDHLLVDEIAARARLRLGSVSTQAVYDVLHALTAAGLARRIEPAGSPARFEGRVGDNHHHLICRSCGAVSDVDCAAGHAPCLHPVDAGDFDVEEAEVIYWGQCPTCSSKTAPATKVSSR